MPKKFKELVKEGIDEEMYDKIATEEDAKDINELKKFLLNADHPVVDGVERPVDGKQVSEGWTLEDPSEFEDEVIEFIEETGGDIDVDQIKEKLMMSEGQFMQVIEYLQDEGILE
jgi:acetyl-CoA decarbonylase/synthase complex subunit beta